MLIVIFACVLEHFFRQQKTNIDQDHLHLRLPISGADKRNDTTNEPALDEQWSLSFIQ